MSNFSYSDYQKVVAQAQSGNSSENVKVGFFKLKDHGDEALIRINVSSMNDLQFATIHQLGAAQRWMKVGCINPVGSYTDNCPFCKAVAEGNEAVGKAAKRVYVQMLVSYKDAATGQFSAAVPVIWERPAGFSSEIASKLNDYGDLKCRVFKVTRNGAAHSMQTSYSISYIPVYDTPEAVPADFSAFANFNIAKHSYWEKSTEDMNTFLATGKFPEVAQGSYSDRAKQAASEPAPAAQAPVQDWATQSFSAPAQPTFNANVQPATTVTNTPPIYQAPAAAPANPFATAPVQPTAPAQQAAPAPAQPATFSVEGRPSRPFGGLTF